MTETVMTALVIVAYISCIAMLFLRVELFGYVTFGALTAMLAIVVVDIIREREK